MINRVVIIVLALIFVIAHISEAQVVTDGLVAYWTFDEPHIDEDIWGGHDGTIFGNPKSRPGKVNEALEFLSPADYIEAEIPDDLLADGATLEVWFLQEEPNTFGVMIEIGPAKADLNIDPERGGRSELWCYLSGGIEGPDGLSDDNWHHAAGAVSEDGQAHYIDGVKVGENTNAVVFDEITKVTIALRAGTSWWWDGMLDEIRIYGRPLSEEEIQRNMESKGISVEPAGKLAETWGKIKS